ncbi:hypothetical protein JCM8097_001357 [Rhodosporidiobolus ruineniae]
MSQSSTSAPPPPPLPAFLTARPPATADPAQLALLDPSSTRSVAPATPPADLPAPPITPTLAQGPLTQSGGSSVLERVRQLEAQARDKQEEVAAAHANEGAVEAVGMAVGSPGKLRRMREPSAEGVSENEVSGDEGGAGTRATFASVPTRPQPHSSISAPVLPASGLVQKRKSWIESGDGDSPTYPTSFSRPSSAAYANPISPSTPGSSRPASPAPGLPPPQRTLSSAVLAAVADTPPRARPPLPPKSAARLSRASSRLSAYSEGGRSGSRSRSSSVAALSPNDAVSPTSSSRPPSQVLRKVPSFITTPAPAPPPIDYSAVSALASLPPSSLSTPAHGLTHPRPRPSVPTSTTGSGPARTPALSVAESSNSSRPSSGAFSPPFGLGSTGESGSGSDRNSFFSYAGAAHGHGDGDDTTGFSSEWGGSKSAMATPATTVDFTPDASPEVSMAEESPSMWKKKRLSKPPGLHLEPQSLAPPPLPSHLHRLSLGLGAGLEGLGIDFEPPTPDTAGSALSGRPSFDGDGDLQRNLERLSLFAATLPSPLAGTRAMSEQPQLTPLTIRPSAGEEERLVVPPASLDSRAALGVAAPADDRTLVFPPRPAADESAPPHPSGPSFPSSRSPRLPREREVSAASAKSSFTTASSSAASSRRPSLLNLPRPQRSYPNLRNQLSLDRLVAEQLTGGESEAYASVDETDYYGVTSNDEYDDDGEDSSFGFVHRPFASGAGGGGGGRESLASSLGSGRASGDRRRFLGFGDLSGGRDSYSGSEVLSPADSERYLPFSSRGAPLPPFAPSVTASGLPRQLTRDSSAGSGLWNEDVPALPFLPQQPGAVEGAPQLVMNAPVEDMVDWSGRAIEKKELPAETTHLMLAHSKTPFQIAPLLTLTVPLLTHGLVVLDISHCGLSEVPSAIASCVFLEELEMSGNPLATGQLPSLLGTLPALNVLMADHCNLSSLPSSLAQLSRLHTLTLRHNQLRTLPSWLCRLSSLAALLVDGNPFHWQLHHLLRPLFTEGVPLPPQKDPSLPPPPVSRGGTPAPRSRSSSPAPRGGTIRSFSPAPLPPGLAAEPAPSFKSISPSPASPISVSGFASPPIASPAFFRSSSSTPIYQAMSTSPALATLQGQIDLGEVDSELERAKQAAESASPFSPMEQLVAASAAVLTPPVLSPLITSAPPLSSAPSVSNFAQSRDATDGENGGTGTVKEKKKGLRKLIKKVSGARMRSGSTASTLARPGALDPDSRTYSQPITRDEESDAEEKTGLMSGRFSSLGRRRKTKQRPALELQGQRHAPAPAKRRSFLMLDAFNRPPSAQDGAPQTPTPTDHASALRGVLAYLKDLDDLSPDLALPTIPLEPAAPRTLRHSPSLESTSPSLKSLRHSPSLGAIGASPTISSRAGSPANIRRAQSTRRLPSAGSNGSSPRPLSGRFSQFYDSEDAEAGRSVTPLASVEEPRKLADNPVKRDAVLKEIVETEQTYLRGLEELCGIYVQSASVPISTAGTGKKDTILPAAERRAVFGNIEAIRDFHRKILLPDLLDAVRSGGESVDVAGKVGEVFMNHASFLKIYSHYINSFDDALARIGSWAKSSSSSRPGTASGMASPAIGSSNAYDASAGVASTLSSSQKKRIKSWMKRCRAHPSHSQISLESYLLLPIQRIPRYRLLLESLLACTPAPADSPTPSAFLDPTSPAPSASSSPSASFSSSRPPSDPSRRLDPHPTLLQAVREMDDVAIVLNESKRENEGRAQLLVWQNRIQQRFKSSLVQPHRTLLRSGNLTLVRSVKRSTTAVEPPLPNLYRKPAPQEEELFTLFQDHKQVELIALLCTDLLVLCKAPPPPLADDPNTPVELYTVLRLNSSQAFGLGGGGGANGQGGAKSDAPVSLFGNDNDMLRMRVGDKAIMYLQCGEPGKARTRKNAHEWANAINLQWTLNA